MQLQSRKECYDSAMRRLTAVRVLGLVAGLGLSCGGGSEADRKGVGAECMRPEDCLPGQRCLAFKGGYCGIQGCQGDKDCPGGSACVTHADSTNYCFRICLEKTECNRNRSVENEANCSSNVTFVDSGNGYKACIPPTGS
jgi:hypothetical protein